MEQTLGTVEATVSDSGRALWCARQMVAAKHTELSRADAKASGVLAAACALPISPLATISDRFLPHPSGRPVWWCWGLGAALWALAVATLLFALMSAPRPDPAQTGEPPPLLALGLGQPLDLIVAEFHRASGAVARKHCRIRAGLLLLAIATVLLFVGSL